MEAWGWRGLLGKRPELFLWIHLQKASETRSTDLFVLLFGPHCEVVASSNKHLLVCFYLHFKLCLCVSTCSRSIPW